MTRVAKAIGQSALHGLVATGAILFTGLAMFAFSKGMLGWAIFISAVAWGIGFMVVERVAAIETKRVFADMVVERAVHVEESAEPTD